MKNWFMNLSNGIKVLIHIINAIIFIAIPIAIEGTTNVPLILLWIVNMVFGIIFIVTMINLYVSKKKTHY